MATRWHSAGPRMIDRLSLYRPFSETSCFHRVLGGGAGSGKSVATVQDFIDLAGSKGKRILVIRKVHRTCRHSTFQLILDVIASMKRQRMVRVNKSEMRFDFPSGGAILHAGLDDPEKIKSIAEIDEIWVEEATEINKAEYQLLTLRLRGEGRKRITLTFNPTVEAKWIRAYLVDRTDEDSPHAEDVYWQVTTARDNPYAGDDYVRRLEQLPDDLREVYAFGKWGAIIKGLIYPTFTVTDEAVQPDFYGLDFGFNAPSTLVACQDRDPIMVVEELLYESGLTNADLIERLERLIPDKSIYIYCDAAEPARIEEMVRAGFNARAADKSVNDGIDTVKRYQLHFTRSSQNAINEIKEYKWDEDRKTGEPLDKPVKRNDHAMDAMRYGIHTHLAEAHNTWGIWGA